MQRLNTLHKSARPSALAWTLLLMAAPLTRAYAQAVFDGTTGNQAAGSVAGPTIDVSQGTRAGGNVFHSFQSFSIPAGQTLTFTNTTPSDPVSNIINRVTGTSISQIDGTLRSTVAGADFYLINPNGIVMGPGSVIDVPASLHISTADELRFENGEVMRASVGNSTFNAAAPISFGFSAAPVGEIHLQGARIVGRDGANISLSARNVRIEEPSANSQNTISNSKGYIALAAIAGTGSVPTARNYTPPQVSSLGGIYASAQGNDAVTRIASRSTKGVYFTGSDVSLTSFSLNAAIDPVPIIPGIPPQSRPPALALRARNEITIVNSKIGSTGFGIFTGNGDIEISATTINLRNSSILSRGRIAANADNISLSGCPTDLCQSYLVSYPLSFLGLVPPGVQYDEKGGIEVHANAGLTMDDFFIATGKQLLTGFQNSRNLKGDKVSITAGNRLVLDRLSTIGSGAQQDQFSSSPGNVDVTSPMIQVLGGSSIVASTRQQGVAGDLKISTQDLILDGTYSHPTLGTFRSRVESNASQSSIGNAGSIFIDAERLHIRNGGSIEAVASTASNGNAGSIIICCGSSLEVSGTGSAITAGTGLDSRGAGGKIFISADSVSLTDGGRMTVESLGSGTAGEINVRTGTFSAVDLSRQPGSPDATASGLGTVSGASGMPGGGGGRIAIEAGTFLLRDGAVVTTDTSGAAPAGRIDIRAGEFIVSGADAKLVSRAVGTLGGNAGDITIGGNNITFRDGATLSTFSQSGAGGNIKLDWNRVTRISGSTITTEVRSGDSNSGNIFFGNERLPDLGFADEFLAYCAELLDIYGGQPRYDPGNPNVPRTLIFEGDNDISCANGGGGDACRPPTPPDVLCIGAGCNTNIDTDSTNYPPNPNTRFPVLTPATVVIVPERNATTRCEGARRDSAIVDSLTGNGPVADDPASLSPAGLPRTTQTHASAATDASCTP